MAFRPLCDLPLKNNPQTISLGWGHCLGIFFKIQENTPQNAHFPVISELHTFLTLHFTLILPRVCRTSRFPQKWVIFALRDFPLRGAAGGGGDHVGS